MSQRVIAGSAKGRRLKMVPGDSTRAILDRVKESLFNILGSWVVDSIWLDLFAGTGAVGIEALSRGADYCLFIDLNKAAIRTIQDNLASTHLDEGAEVLQISAFDFLRRTPGEDDPFEFIYIAPPQYKGWWRSALELIDEQPDWLFPEGQVIVQIDPREYEDVNLKHLDLYDQRVYGKTMLCFYERRSEEDES
ncbi:MAG: 16S rRNA (guanine(966)-N(2))-methyltransferase RsmD [Chloroflexi bacterium]|nr:16S rRNA (guanine(966)-N(2))-methyltransferase RsmD [Chloroflexota bacterium]